MSWAYLDDRFPEHPKVIAAGGDAAWLFVAGLCWSRRHLKAGEVPKSIVGRLTDRRGATKLAARLCDVGLWIDKGDHYAIHDYDEWNGSEEAARNARKEKASRAAGARWKRAQAQARADAQASTEQCVGSTPSNARADAQAMPPASGRASVPNPNPNPSTSIGSETHSFCAPPPAEPRSDEHEHEPHPDRAVLDHIAVTIGWDTPGKRPQLQAMWDWGATILDRRPLEDTLLRCTTAANAGYLRTAITRTANEAGIDIPPTARTQP